MGVVALVAANNYVIFFNISWGPVMWVMLEPIYTALQAVLALTNQGLAQHHSSSLECAYELDR